MSQDLPPSVAAPARPRVSVDLSPSLLLLLDHVAEAFSQSRADVLSGLLVGHLPELLERADLIRRRVRELNPGGAKGARNGVR